MLGPGIIVLGTPSALAVAIYAMARAADRGFALAALGISAAELLLVLTVLVLNLLSGS
jgi:hypothetical protein